MYINEFMFKNDSILQAQRTLGVPKRPQIVIENEVNVLKKIH